MRFKFYFKNKKYTTPHAIRGAGGYTYLIILFPLWVYSLITGWGSKHVWTLGGSTTFDLN